MEEHTERSEKLLAGEELLKKLRWTKDRHRIPKLAAEIKPDAFLLAIH